jgi:hypothetical protein
MDFFRRNFPSQNKLQNRHGINSGYIMSKIKRMENAFGE